MSGMTSLPTIPRIYTAAAEWSGHSIISGGSRGFSLC